MGAFIDNEVTNYGGIKLPYSHAAGFYAEERTDLVACADLRPPVMEEFGKRYDVPKERQYTDYREMISVLRWLKRTRWSNQWSATGSPSTWARTIVGTPALTR